MKQMILPAIVVLVAVAGWFLVGGPAREEQELPGDKSSRPFEVVAENLEIPWESAFLPDGDFLVTERPGRLVRIGKGKKVYQISGVAHIGEGGLLGLALSPKFNENNFIYLYLTTREGGIITNRVERYRLARDVLQDKQVILSGIPGASIHDGGRIAFGPAFAPGGASAGKPDYHLYITTGEAGDSKLSQDRISLGGKILRVKDDGSIPEDNPFGNAVYSWGHRNSQGLAWDAQDRLWATEHGRSGVASGFDELNLIEKGKNYGWPEIQGDETKSGMEKPVIHSGPTTTWAPAGAAFYEDSIFFGGLRGEALYEYVIDKKELKTHFKGQFGRVRAVVLGPDNFLFISTSNRDGRGTVREGDDKIIKVNVEMLE